MPKNSQKLNIDIETISAIFIIIFVSAFILANFFVGFILPLYILAMGISLALTLFFPRSGLFALTFLTIIFERFFTLSTIIMGKVEYKIYPLDIILLAIFISVLIQLIFKIIKSVHMQKSDYLLGAFIFLNIFYFFFSTHIIKADSILAFSTLKNYAFYPLIYFTTFILIRNADDLKRFFQFFLTGAIFIISFIIYGALNGEGLWTQFTPLSTEGVRILAFTHGLYLSLAFISALVYLIFQKGKKNLFYWLLAIWGIGIVGTMMRHLWISLISTMFLIYILLSKENRKKMREISYRYIFLFLCLGIFVFYVMSMNPSSKIYTGFQNTTKAVFQRGASIGKAKTDESFAWRKLVWNASYKEFQKNPILGIGTGKKVYAETESYRDYIEVRNIHNSYLSIFIQLGILGIGIFLLFLYSNIKELIQSITIRENIFYKFSVLGALSIFVIALCFQPYLETNLLSIFFWIALGISRKITV
ncbi:MAG: O-antigen ligase family protein [Parcubacteria group bacterium]|jgi:O-antigen ligase